MIFSILSVLTPTLDVYSVKILLVATIHKYNFKFIYFSLNFNIHFVPLLMLLVHVSNFQYGILYYVLFLNTQFIMSQIFV